MVRTIAAVSLAIFACAAPAAAQVVEASVNVGYTLAEGISVNDRDILGAFYDKVEVNSGGSFHLTFGVNATPNVLIEFLYGRQDSKLTAEGANKIDVSDLKVDNYHGLVTYQWGESDAMLRPFAFFGLGATHYSFGNLLLPNATGSIAGNTQFSTTWGAGVKAYFSPNIGIKATARWTPTYIKSDPAGYWCDPFYGCWVLGDPDYSNQFDLSGGLTFRF